MQWWLRPLLRHTTAVFIALGLGSAIIPVRAVTVRGTVFFNTPPQLLGAVTTENTVDAWTATYYFTLNLPDNAGEPLRRVTIVQSEGTDRVIFEPGETEAFEGPRNRLGQKLAIETVDFDPAQQTLSLIFDPPIPPGRTVTIGLSPRRNPLYSGVYLFGVTAFPAGEQAHGQFLGYGRLHFYDSGYNSLFPLRYRGRPWWR